MSELDDLADVLPANLRSVWPHVADCANRVGGVLMGGTAVAIHLRHRVSEDLDVITLEKFSGKALEKRLRKAVSVVDIEEVSDNMFHGFVDGVKVDIFRALPSNEVQPSQMRWVGPSATVAGMNIGSIPDLMAAKLDVIRFRPKLRDYLDLAAMDQSGACSLESSLGYYCQRFGYSYPPHVLEEITRLLDNPGTLPSDPDYEDLRADALAHLHGRVPDLRDRLAEMRDISATDPLQNKPRLHAEDDDVADDECAHLAAEAIRQRAQRSAIRVGGPRCGVVGAISRRPCIGPRNHKGPHYYR